MRSKTAVFVLLAAAAAACRAASSSSGPATPPTADEVKAFLSQVSAASTDDGALRGFFEGGRRYPEDDFRAIKATGFWKLRPGSRVKRLGPDGFKISFLPTEPPQRDGPVTTSWRVTLPVRRGKDGQLRVLTREETERLAKLPVPEDPESEVVSFDYPEEGSFLRDEGNHFLAELQATARGETVFLALRFDPPLTGPGLKADAPMKQEFLLGDEISLKVAFDADASPATGFRLDEFYRRAEEEEKGAQDRKGQIERWKAFGLDKTLAVDGKQFVQADGSRVWGLRAILRDEKPELAGGGAIRFNHEVVLEKALGDPELTVAGDTLTLALPATVLPMRPGASYRVMMEQNSGFSSAVAGAKRGRVGISK